MRVSGTKVTPPQIAPPPKENNSKVSNKTPSVQSEASTRGATNTTDSKVNTRYKEPQLTQKVSSTSSAYAKNPLTDDVQSLCSEPI